MSLEPGDPPEAGFLVLNRLEEGKTNHKKSLYNVNDLLRV